MDASAYAEILRRHPRRVRHARLGLHLLLDLLSWSLIIYVRDLPFGSLVAGVLFAVFTFRAFGLMHDCVHGAGARSRGLNRLVGELYGAFSFLPYTSWRQLHLDHHKWTGNVEKDPSMRLLLRFRDAGFRLPGRVRASWRYWLPLLGVLQHVVFWTQTVSRREFLFLAIASSYLATVAFVLGPTALATGAFAYVLMVEIINFPHHLELQQYDGEAQHAPRDQARFARSSVYPRFFARLILLNFNLHVEHHLYPSHPWYQLDDLRQALRAAGVAINESKGNAWILNARARPIEDVFARTFPADQRQRQARKAA